jgi:hypothetical protein
MKTYTIALWYDLLIATVPDGADMDAAVAAERERAAIPEMTATSVYKGLVLTNDPLEGDEVVYSGTRNGCLFDEASKPYQFAVRR